MGLSHQDPPRRRPVRPGRGTLVLLGVVALVAVVGAGLDLVGAGRGRSLTALLTAGGRDAPDGSTGGPSPTVPASPASPSTPAGPSARSSGQPGRTPVAVPPASASGRIAASAPPAPGRSPRTPPRRTVTRSPARGVHAPADDLTDLAYATGSAAQALDLYLPRRTGTAVPLVVYVHGGAFLGGDKADHFPQIGALRTAGYAVASVNYRLSGEAPFPAGVQDVKAAVRWLRAAAPKYGIDPARFGAWGDSAGGHLVAMLGATGDQRTDFDDAALGHAGVSSAVQAVVDWYGPTDFLLMDDQSARTGCARPQVHDEAGSPESRWLGAPIQTVPDAARAANPITWVRTAGHLPPYLVVHGDSDCNVPHGQSELLVEALHERDAAVTFTLLPGVGHADPVFTKEQIGPAIAFLDRTLGHSR
jgi:acetyl esterase/lipase